MKFLLILAACVLAANAMEMGPYSSFMVKFKFLFINYTKYNYVINIVEI